MEKLTSIKEEGLSQIEACEDLAQLQQLRVLYLCLLYTSRCV